MGSVHNEPGDMSTKVEWKMEVSLFSTGLGHDLGSRIVGVISKQAWEGLVSEEVSRGLSSNGASKGDVVVGQDGGR